MTIGWYVHHQGAGHLHRFLATRPWLGDDVVGLSTLPRPAGIPADGWIALPDDAIDGTPDDPTAGGTLHWVPRGVDGLRERTALIAAWAAAAKPSVLVVDVSVEVALLGRLLSLPTVLVGQRGDRGDPAHALGYAGASRVLVPWTRATHPGGGGPPDDRLTFCGAVSRFDDAPTPDDARPASACRDVLLLVGAGGHALRADDVADAAASDPQRTWHVAGALRVPGRPGVIDHGPAADVWALLHRCGVVVATAGANAIAEVAAARRPLVLLPQDRPFDEQRAHAAALVRAGLADVPGSWPPA
ncbi:MAG: glycosyltransferase, partial [Patulibacter sp.]